MGFPQTSPENQGQNQEPSLQPEPIRQECARISKTWDQLDSEAINWKTHWQECYEYIVPRKQDVIAQRMPGDRRDEDIYDSTAVRANEMLASALHAMLTNPETKFFDIIFGDPKLMAIDAVKNWCQEVGDILFRILNTSNFQTEVYEIYIDLGAAGTACLFTSEDPDRIVHFNARALKEIRVNENQLGLIDTVYRRFKMSAQQIIDEFGSSNVPYEVIRAAASASNDQMEIIHAVEPARKEDLSLKARGHLFKSTYVLAQPKFRLSTGSFHEMPYAVPRWSKTTGEKYGRGPGMNMLPDIMMLNAMMLTVIQGAQKTVDPPLMVPDDGVIGVVRLTPGGLTVVRPGEQNQIKPLITDARIDFGEKMVENVRERIRDGFHINQMTLQQGPQKTAEEVKQLTEESLRLLGPVLGRQHFEFLQPTIYRVFQIANRKGVLPPAPKEVAGKKFEVRYSSLIARAQRMNEATSIARALSIIQPIAQVKPEIADIYNADRIGREIWDSYGCSHKLLNTQQELKKIRDSRAAAQQDAKQKLDQAHQAEVAKNTAPMLGAMSQMRQQGQ